MTPSATPRLPSPLLAELRWLVRLRWGIGLIVVLGILANAIWTAWTDVHASILAVGLVILLFNIGVWTTLRALATKTEPRPGGLWLAWLQILVDMTLLTLLMLWTGGVGSPLLWFFVLHVVYASLILPQLASYAGAGVAIIFVTGGLWLDGQWPADHRETLVWLGWILLLLLAAYLTDHIVRRLRDQQAELRRQHRRTRAILDTAAEGIITIDERGIMESANPAIEKIFGYDAHELIGCNVSTLMPEPYRSEHDGYIESYLRTNEARIIGIGREALGRHKDGSSFPIDLTVSEVRVGDRRIFTGIVRDISERKRAELALKELNEELKRQQQAFVQQEKMAAMGQMAAGVAHEISNPVASMDSLLELIKRKPDRLTSETVSVLRKQVERINRIVQQMTDFAHPNETAWEELPVNAVVESALDMVRFDHRVRRITMQRDLSADVGNARLMAQAIQQVVVNLIMNAVDALNGEEKPMITVRTRRSSAWAIIEVADNGPGITTEHQNRVFEPFFTTKPVGQGTGLGLSISYSLVERHSGRLTVASTPGAGATFSISLPVGAEASRPGEDAAGSIPDSENTPS